MKVIVETPRWSLSKYAFEDGGFRVEYRTPFPTLFNYGFVEHTIGDDGKPKDAIILGGRLRQGDAFEVRRVGVVHFIDDGLVDDKMITSFDGRVTLLDKVMMHVFFTVYMLFKITHYYLHEDRVARCRYLGFSLLP
jgi:inorganic pyrophosphatase